MAKMAEELRERIKNLGLGAQTDIAQLARIGYNQLSDKLYGRRSLTLQEIKIISDAIERLEEQNDSDLEIG